jgi:thioredoxin 1
MNEAKFREAVLESDIPVVVYFYTRWCGACRRMEPTIGQLASEHEGKIKFVAVNAAKTPQLAAKYYVRTVPTYIVFIDGKPQERLVGASQSFRGWVEKWAQPTQLDSTRED